MSRVCTVEMLSDSKRATSRIPLLVLTVTAAIAVLFALLHTVNPSRLEAQTSGHHQGADRDALIALYNATDGPNWSRDRNWLSDRPLDQWYGVTTGGDGRVTELDLSVNQLTGSISPELGNLTRLYYLSLRDNQLTGPISPDLGILSCLYYMSLGGNRLTGPIPSELGSLTNLRYLLLRDNQLMDPVPSELSSLTNLRYLLLGGNRFTGAEALAQIESMLPNMTGLGLGDSQLTSDELRPHVSSLSGLRWLYLSDNWLSGDQLLSMLAGLSNLDRLYLDGNQLTGFVPSELGNLSDLELLLLHDNELTGSLPRSLINLRALETFSFGNNDGLCAPPDGEFQIWLLGIRSSDLPEGAAKLGPNCEVP